MQYSLLDPLSRNNSSNPSRRERTAQIAAMLSAGASITTIASVTGLSADTVYYHRAKLGLSKQQENARLRTQIAEMRTTGQTTKEIASTLGITKDRIQYLVPARFLGPRLKEWKRPPQQRGRSTKLSAQRKRLIATLKHRIHILHQQARDAQIIAMQAEGYMANDIATTLVIPIKTVYICTRKHSSPFTRFRIEPTRRRLIAVLKRRIRSFDTRTQEERRKEQDRIRAQRNGDRYRSTPEGIARLRANVERHLDKVDPDRHQRREARTNKNRLIIQMAHEGHNIQDIALTLKVSDDRVRRLAGDIVEAHRNRRRLQRRMAGILRRRIQQLKEEERLANWTSPGQRHKERMSNDTEYAKRLRSYKAAANLSPTAKAGKRRRNQTFVARRRASSEIGVVTITLEALVQRQKGKCYLCGDKFSRRQLRLRPSYEHIIPISKGGTNANDNLVASHFACNSAKGSKLPEEAAPLFGRLLL